MIILLLIQQHLPYIHHPQWVMDNCSILGMLDKSLRENIIIEKGVITMGKVKGKYRGSDLRIIVGKIQKIRQYWMIHP